MRGAYGVDVKFLTKTNITLDLIGSEVIALLFRSIVVVYAVKLYGCSVDKKLIVIGNFNFTETAF